MQSFNDPLDNVRVASPCNVDWDQMTGNERARFCGQCHLNVYNLSSMTRAEAEHLIVNTEGRLCVRYFRRKDGSILTKDCPVGLRAIKRRLSYVSRAVTSAVLTFLAGIGVYEATRVVESRRQPEMMGVIAVKHLGPPVVIPMGLEELREVKGGVSFNVDLRKKPRQRRR
jgi:hypothetical protein